MYYGLVDRSEYDRFFIDSKIESKVPEPEEKPCPKCQAREQAKEEICNRLAQGERGE